MKKYKVPKIYLFGDIEQTMVLCRTEDYPLMRDYFQLVHEPNKSIEDIIERLKNEEKSNKKTNTT